MQAPTKYEPVINLKAAKALGLDSAADLSRVGRRGDRIMPPYGCQLIRSTQHRRKSLLGLRISGSPVAVR